MQFDPNGTFLYGIVAIVIAYVVLQSIVFLVKAWKQARKLNMDKALLRRTVLTSSIFTIAPAFAILLGVVALSKALGFPLPWLRLSVIGALTYETAAAATAAEAIGLSLDQRIMDPQAFATIAWVMTVGIVPGLILTPLFGKKIENGVVKLQGKDRTWGNIFMTGLFLGMISAFLGMVFATVSEGLVGWIPVFVMLASALLMALCGLIRKVCHAKWIEDYALPLSMLGGMALSIPITAFVTSIA